MSPSSNPSSFRPSFEALGDRIAPHAGLWSSFGGSFSLIDRPVHVAPPSTGETGQVATHFVVVAQRSAYAGEEARFVVLALDENNRPVRDYAGTVTLTTTDAGATLESDYTFTEADRGRHVFSMTVSAVGDQTITVSAGDVTGSTTLTVKAAQVVTEFAVRVERAAYAGAETRVLVTALDASGRPVANYTGTVALTTSDDSIALPASYPFTAADKGSHVFTITPSAAGDLTVTATDAANAAVTGTRTVAVAEAPVAVKFAVVTRPAFANGSAMTVFVVALDASNHPVPTYTGTVTLTSTDAAATLPASYTFTAADRGVKAFTVTLATTGSQTITATDAANGELLGTATIRVVDASSIPAFGGHPRPGHRR